MGNWRFDRKKLLIGTYCLRDYAFSEAHVRMLADAGINYICSAPADRNLLDRCEKYGIGIFASGVLPGWWGGDGDRAGQLAGTVPVSSYEKAAEAFDDHPAIWGLDMGDEPSALDFPHYGKLFEAMARLFPDHFPYLNLYPNYASVPENDDGQTRSQLGTRTYQEHIDRYAEGIDADYICYDHYMYALNVTGAYENLRVVANKCRETGRDMWIVLQVNSNRPEEWITLPQLRHQAYTALAFGAKAINWACWTAGWWNNQVLDDQGRPTEQYGKLCIMNRELHALSERYMKYQNVSTHFLGFEGSESLEKVNQAAEKTLSAGSFRDVKVGDGCAAVVGYMQDGMGGEALMIADGTDPLDLNAQGKGPRSVPCASGASESAAYTLTFRLDNPALTPEVTVNGLPAKALKIGEGEYAVRIEHCSGVLVELK